MLSFLKKIFGATEPAKTSVPYKVEAPVVAKPAKKTATKSATKPAVKAKTARKPKV